MRVKRIVAMLLCLLMTWGLSPVSAWAVDDAATAASEQADSTLAPTQEPATEPTPALTATSTEEPTSKTTAELAEELTPEPANTPELTDTPEPAEPSEPSEEAISYLPFDQSRTANDVTVRVSAPEGVFPDGAELSVTAVPSAQVESAVAAERDENANVAVSYTFDIKVMKDGVEYQPGDNQLVKVSFALAQANDENLDATIYHISDGEADMLDTTTENGQVSAETDGFSYYTVEFTYNDLQYVLSGGESVALSAILDKVGLAGEPTNAISSAPDLFSVEMRDGAWIVAAQTAFHTEETLTVTINGTDYEITVTDDFNFYPYEKINGMWACDGGYVWMGGDDPIKWHIIGANNSNYLLISAEVLGGTMTWWAARDYGETTVFSSFAAVEQEAVPTTIKNEPADYVYVTNRYGYINQFTFGPASINGKMFLLSAQEAETYFNSNDARKPAHWWLRSPAKDDDSKAACIIDNGGIYDVIADLSGFSGARPAFQLDRSLVICESAAEGGKSSAEAGSGEFGTITGGDERKLTLIDNSMTDFKAYAGSGTTVEPGGTFTVRYTGAGIGTPSGKYVSAIIFDKNGTPLYHASIWRGYTGNGKWDMTIPSELTAGKYTLKVFLEQQNGDRKTDFASPPVSIDLTVATTCIVTYKVENGTWADGTTEDKTEGVPYGSTLVDVPTGMTPSLGYTGGTWDTDPAGAVITENTTFTHTFVWKGYSNYGDGLVNDIPAADGNYVWMGDDNPIKWHIIGANDSRYLLISAGVLSGVMNWESAKDYCGNALSSFTAAEQEAVPTTIITEPDYYLYESLYHINYGPADVNGKMFLLSPQEAETYFNSDDARRPGRWWLRSQGPYGIITACVNMSGQVDWTRFDDDNEYGVRPAFQLDRSFVLFESAAEGDKSSTEAGSGEFGTITGGNEVKLTLIDSTIAGFSASAGSTTVSSGGSLAVSYSGVTSGNWVSALLCDEAGSILYYASLTPEASDSGNWNMTIPSELTEGSYTLKIFSEQQNGDKKTDYASTPVEIGLTVEGVAPATYTVTVNGGTGSAEYAEGESVTITASVLEDGRQFKEWSGAEGLTFTSGSKTSSTATFTMPAEAVTVTATYADIVSTTSTVNIKVWPTGNTFSIVAEPGDSVENVKAKIEDKTGIPPERQMLYYNNKKLTDGTLLADYDYNGGHLILYEMVTVTYKVVDGTWSDGTTEEKTETVANGDSAKNVPTGMVASSGFTGGAWDTDPSTATITGNTTFTYTFEAIPAYTVRFDANVPANASTSCSGSMDDSVFEYIEKKALSPNDYSLPGYDFAGWNTEADGSGDGYADKAEVQSLTDGGGTVTLYAQWSAKPYKITYYESDDAGSQTHTQEATFDQPGKLDEVSTFGWNYSGEALHGWSGTGIGLGSFYEDGEDFCNLCGAPNQDGSVSDVTLTADWVQNGQIVVTVTKDGVPQGGLANSLVLTKDATEFTVPVSDADVSGRYVFDPAGATIGGQPAQLPAGAYQLRFDAEGYPSASAQITYGENHAVGVVFDYYTVSLTKDPVYADFNQVEISGGAPVAGAPGAVVALDGDTLGIKTSVSDGYRFEGYIAVGVMPIWEDGDSSKAEQTIKVQGQADIMALVAPIPYSVTVEGGTADKATATLGETVTITANTPESGKAFVQWAQIDDIDFENASSATTTFVMPAKDVTVTAVTAPIVIDAIGGKTYTGSAIEPTDEVRVSLEGVDLQLTTDDYTVAFEDNVDAGDAKVIVTMKAPRAGSATSAFEITPKPATIMVDGASKVEGDDDPAFTGTVEGLVAEGDLGEISYKRTGDDEEPGTYEGVLTATYTENGNYDVTVVPGDFTIKALYKLRWLDSDGGVLQEKAYVEGDEPPVYDGREPAKAATVQYTYKFTGWDDGTVEGTTTTYRPLFSETVNKYKVTFVDYDGTTVLKEATEYDYGTPAAGIARPADPTREADAEYTYVFSGWTPGIVAVTGNATYTATYEAIPIKATLTFDLGGGMLNGKTGTITVEANVGDVIKLPGAPMREGYTFKCWRGSEYAAGADYKVEDDHAFTAEWEKNVQPSPDKPGAKSATPATGDAMGTAVVLLAIAAIGSLIVLAACALRRKPSKGRHAR